MSEHAELVVGGEPVEVVFAEGREAVSSLFSVRVVGRVDAVPSLAGAEATLTLSDGFGATRPISGVVASGRAMHRDDGTIELEIDLRPEAHLLTLGGNCRSFQQASVVDIATEVLGGVAHRLELTGAYATRAYTVQYRESDWRFLCRLFEEAGIYFWFDHAAGSMLVLSDASPNAPELDGGATIPFLVGRGMTVDHEVIEQLGGAASVVPTRFSTRSFDPEKPDLDLSASAGSGALEIYDAPGGGPTTPEAVGRKVALQAEAAGAAGGGAGGLSNSVRIYPGRILAVVDHPRLDGSYFVRSSGFRVVQRRGDDNPERPYRCTFDALASNVPFRPTPTHAPAPQPGLQAGLVVGPPGEEIYDDELGRVRVQLHWDRGGSRDDQSGTWMRVAQRGTADSMQMPRVGWNVLTLVEEGSAEAPLVHSRIIDAEHPPAYTLPDNKTRVVFKTATSPADGSFIEIYFEDRTGAEEMFLNASRDMNLLTRRVKSDGVGRDQRRKIGRDRRLHVGAAQTESVQGNRTVAIGEQDEAEIGQSEMRSVGASFRESIGGSRDVKTGQEHGIAVRGDRSLSVGAAMIGTSLGTFGASAEMTHRLVGGAEVKTALQTVVDGHGAVSVQTIGGAKLEIAGKSRPLDVDGRYLETVGGTMILETAGTYTDGAVETADWSVTGKLTGEAPEILIKADEKIELVCGDSTIVVEPTSVEIRAKAIDLEGANLEIETKKIEHN